MNDFIHNANHELKTPISVISSNLQLIKSTKSYEEDLIINSINEIKRIDNLIVGLSNLSNIHAISDMMEISLKNEIEDMIQELKQDTEKQNILLTFEVRKNIKIRANKEYFYIMFSNLLRNAIKYNRQNGQIHITLDKHILSISNT
jgi:signal transduction histidine kinase